MKRPSRIELYKQICKMVGIPPQLPAIATGYFSRKEMMELVLYLQRIETKLEMLKDSALAALEHSSIGDPEPCEQTKG